MQQDVLSDLVSKQQRETAGSSSASRFDYQKSWAFCEMLRRHMQDADYLVAFEFHDDVVFLEPASDPSRVDFVQVKTSSSALPKKLSTLLSRRKNANSILGKMCLNFSGLCATHEVRIILVSNVAFEFADKGMCVVDIDKKYRDTIIAKLKVEIPTLTDSQLDAMHFLVSGVSLEAIATYLNGQAMDLFQSHFGENHGLNVHSWVRLVQGEIARKNNYPSDQITNVSDLMQKKCMSRAAIIASLNLVARHRATPKMNIIGPDLQVAGWTTAEIIQTDKALSRATVDLTDATNADAQAVVAKFSAYFEEDPQHQASLSQYVHDVVQLVAPTVSHPYNDIPYLRALAILVFHEKI